MSQTARSSRSPLRTAYDGTTPPLHFISDPASPLIPLAVLAILLAAVLICPGDANAQTPTRVEQVRCETGGWDDGEDLHCEEREFRLDARDRLTVDAGPNGGISVIGWDRAEIRVLAKVRARDRGGDPAALAREIRIRTDGRIEAEGPKRWGDRSSWSVSYEIRAPRETALRLDANNGGIRLERLAGLVDARTTNGGIHLVGDAGDIRGETTNGGLHVELLGERWQGPGVDLKTTNGGIEIVGAEGYSAELETGTINGGIRLDVPVRMQGRIDRRIRTTLGEGGPLIRALTTNGGVVIRQ